MALTIEIGKLRLSATRFKELDIGKTADVWRVFDVTGNTPAAIGPHYQTKLEAFADLDRYATEYGATLR